MTDTKKKKNTDYYGAKQITQECRVVTSQGQSKKGHDVFDLPPLHDIVPNAEYF